MCATNGQCVSTPHFAAVLYYSILHGARRPPPTICHRISFSESCMEYYTRSEGRHLGLESLDVYCKTVETTQLVRDRTFHYSSS